MIAIPAVDLRDGACVQLVGGSYAEERVRLSNPADVARQWADAGFKQLHVVDLDAAMRVGSNDGVIRDILDASTVDVQVGGGVRESTRIEELLNAGAKRVVVGTRALEEPAWLAEQAKKFPGVIVLAADVRRGRITVRGWTETLDQEVETVAGTLNELPLAGLLVTAVDVEGQLKGPDLPLIERVVRASKIPVIASGGVTTIDDLRALAGRGAWAAVIGMALYTGTLDARAAAQEFGS